MKRSTATSLDDQDRQALRRALLDRRTALQGELALRSGGASRVQHARELLLQDGDDAPARDADREVDQALDDQDRLELVAISEALIRLDDGSHGWCDDCGEAIAIERLRALPQARHCIACESQREKRSGQGTPPRL